MNAATPTAEAVPHHAGVRLPAVPVVDRMQRLVGLLTPENASELMMIHAALPRKRRGMELAPASFIRLAKCNSLQTPRFTD